MNTIFIDIKNKKKLNRKVRNNKNKKISKLQIHEVLKNIYNTIFKFNFGKDIINSNVFNNKMYIEFNEKYIKKENNKNSLRRILIKKHIQRKIKKIDSIYLVFSNEFDKNNEYKNNVLELFKNDKKNINEINKTNHMLINDIKYIDNYIKEKDIKLNKLKILVVLNNIFEYNNEKVLEYISKYKFIDILITNNFSRSEYLKLVEKANLINKEYGTTIEVIQRKNLQEYNVYLMFFDILKENFNLQYILRKNSKYINLKNSDEDIFSEECIEYEKSKYDIKIIFSRMKITQENFSKNKLGAWYKLEKSI